MILFIACFQKLKAMTLWKSCLEKYKAQFSGFQLSIFASVYREIVWSKSFSGFCQEGISDGKTSLYQPLLWGGKFCQF